MIKRQGYENKKQIGKLSNVFCVIFFHVNGFFFSFVSYSIQFWRECEWFSHYVNLVLLLSNFNETQKKKIPFFCF